MVSHMVFPPGSPGPVGAQVQHELAGRSRCRATGDQITAQSAPRATAWCRIAERANPQSRRPGGHDVGPECMPRVARRAGIRAAPGLAGQPQRPGRYGRAGHRDGRAPKTSAPENRVCVYLVDTFSFLASKTRWVRKRCPTTRYTSFAAPCSLATTKLSMHAPLELAQTSGVRLGRVRTR